MWETIRQRLVPGLREFAQLIAKKHKMKGTLEQLVLANNEQIVVVGLFRFRRQVATTAENKVRDDRHERNEGEPNEQKIHCSR